MRELRVTNAKLYDAEDKGEEELERQRKRIEAQSEDQPAQDGQPVK